MRCARLLFGRPGPPGLTPLISGAIGFTPYPSRVPRGPRRGGRGHHRMGFEVRCRGWVDAAPRGSAAGRREPRPAVGELAAYALLVACAPHPDRPALCRAAALARGHRVHRRGCCRTSRVADAADRRGAQRVPAGSVGAPSLPADVLKVLGAQFARLFRRMSSAPITTKAAEDADRLLEAKASSAFSADGIYRTRRCRAR